MKFVRKHGDGGYHLTQASAKQPTTSQTASSRWRTFKHKQSVLESLRSEQYQLCCYSEVRADQLGLGYHIEHVENKSQHPQRTFDYTNFAASALTSDDLSSLGNGQLQTDQKSAIFGGHAVGKQRSVDMQRFISPHQADCSRFFSFLSDGRITPSDVLNAEERDRAQYTIDLLNLNSPFLLTERQKWWDELDQLWEQHLQNDMDLHCLAGVDLIPRNQALSPFFSLTRQFFGRIAEAVICENAPEL